MVHKDKKKLLIVPLKILIVCQFLLELGPVAFDTAYVWLFRNLIYVWQIYFPTLIFYLKQKPVLLTSIVSTLNPQFVQPVFPYLVSACPCSKKIVINEKKQQNYSYYYYFVIPVQFFQMTQLILYFCQFVFFGFQQFIQLSQHFPLRFIFFRQNTHLFFVGV